MGRPVISIICNTFNQEKYIAQALDSFLMQQVDVPFEILVHDDASTDRTAQIVREYESKYPDVIKPIYQTENQYSKDIRITPTYQIPRAQGKYIAFCEGDDYWTDPDKLRIQYEYMEQHPECSLCCHAYSTVNREGKLIERKANFPQDCEVPMSRLIGNQLEVPHFATLFARNEGVLKEFRSPFLGVGCNDMIIRLYCATKGYIWYINRDMSCYRRFTEGSWTSRMAYNPQKLAAGYRRYIPFLGEYNRYTGGRYEEEITAAIDRREFEIALLEDDFRTARSKQAFRKASGKRKVYIMAGCLVPGLISAVRKLEKQRQQRKDLGGKA